MKSALFTLGLIALLLAQAPPNDNCQDAIQLTIGGCLTGQTTQNATTQAGEPTGCTTTSPACSRTQSVWYYFQAGANDSVLRITVDRTNLVNCLGGLVVYGPFSSLPTCFTGFTQVWCQNILHGGNLGGGGSNSAYYLDLPVQPNRYYMVQVWGAEWRREQ
jgi:hypothetical protein